MTSQILTPIEYLVQTDNILGLVLYLNLILKSSLITSFQYDLMIIQKWLTFHWVTPVSK